MILFFLLTFLLAGLSYGIFIQKPEYASSMQIAAIEQKNSRTGDFNLYVDGNLISGILTSDSVLNSVIDDNNLLTKDDGTSNTRINARKELKDNIDTKVDNQSKIIKVTVKNKSPDKALDVIKSLYDSSLLVLQETGTIVSEKKDAYIKSEILDSIAKIQKNKEESATSLVNKDTDEILKTLSLLTLYEEGSVYRNSTPLVVQLVSPPTLPDQPLPRGRGKIVVLSALLGLFIGITFAFLRHFWYISSTDPETEEKVKKLKELLGLKTKSSK